jgi:basic membrane protein A and related proteins
VDVAVYRIVEEVVNGKFQPGIRVFGLAEEGVGYVRDDENADLLPASVGEQVDALRTRVVAGEIEVPTAPGQPVPAEGAGDGN